MIFLPKAIQKPRNVLPKTGQITSYQAGDDGTYEAGWWRRRLNANNKTRFRSVVIGGDTIILDYATRLMWRDYGELGDTYDWIVSITIANGFVYAGFSDWRLPNRLELLSLVNHDSVDMMYSDCPLTLLGTSALYWTSTTLSFLTSLAFCVIFGAGGSSPGDSYAALKTTPCLSAFCREF